MPRQEKKAEEIRSGYDQINRDQAEIKRQVQEIRLDHDRIAQELESSKQDEQELESFIQEKQSELDEWKEEESQVTKALEEIRLQASYSGTERSFRSGELKPTSFVDPELWNREKEDMYESLTQSSQEMEKKKQSIEDLRKEAETCGSQEETDHVQLENLQKEREKRNSSHKEFFEKRDQLSGQIGLLDKEMLPSEEPDGETGREQGRTYFLYVGGIRDHSEQCSFLQKRRTYRSAADEEAGSADQRRDP